MKLSYTTYSLKFKHPFGLSYGSRTTTEVVYVKIEQDGLVGYGEAALPPYLGETQTSVIDFVKKAVIILKTYKLPFLMEEVINAIDTISENNNAAKACIDIALHDLLGNYLNKPVYALLGLEKPQPKNTSVTISIGDLNLIPEKLQELEDYKILKIKLGNKNDKEIIKCIRANTDKPLVVDVNQGWTDKHYALEMIEWLNSKNVLFVEQPLAKNNYDDMAWLSKHSPIAIIADESMLRFSDMDKIADCFNGINLKLMKCTGLFEAVKIINYATKKGLKINIGCMSESSCGIAAAAQLMQHVDWIDLDGPLLINNNPFAGVSFKAGKLEINNVQGTGAELVNKGLSFIVA
ncbi:MAG TPA: dipeptide epimerase [Bacteroidia bacterium]|jgi:L-alanine-DL-glutamate epimerase-like enolase superfamily enzyme|nr:dipeptide epimerase [Bacteroidia bacterium]